VGDGRLPAPAEPTAGRASSIGRRVRVLPALSGASSLLTSGLVAARV